jgi:NADH:ubiquinone oxidoreductase subunit H
MTFALFFLAEYSHIILMSLITVILFFGGWLSPIPWISIDMPIDLSSLWLGIKTSLFVFAFIWTRATFPRIRYDQLMQLLWKSYLPLSLAYVIFVASILISFNGI